MFPSAAAAAAAIFPSFLVRICWGGLNNVEMEWDGKEEEEVGGGGKARVPSGYLDISR